VVIPLSLISVNGRKRCALLFESDESGFVVFTQVKVDLAMFDNFRSCTDFTQGLLREESVLVLPGMTTLSLSFLRGWSSPVAK
jgi:hypothetical protein